MPHGQTSRTSKRDEHEHTIGQVTEAREALSARRDKSEQEIVGRDALTQHQESELADLRGQLEDASTDAAAVPRAEGEVTRSQEDRDELRTELTSAHDTIAAAHG